MTPERLPDPIAVAISFGAVLGRLDISYVVGGSLASSVHGEPRSTNDIDVVAALTVDHVEVLVGALHPEYYVSETAVRDAIWSASSFNAIHFATAVKVDVFVAGDDPFEAERLRSRQLVRLADDPAARIFVDVAEHVILRKLEWFRRGGELSERQWRDVLGVLRVRAATLDFERLRAWAPRLGVADLLDRALAEAGPRHR